MQGGTRLSKHENGKGFTVEKDDYVLAEGPNGERVWIHKRTGEIRKTKPSQARKTVSERGAEIVKDEKEKGFRAEKQDYVLAEGPSGERVWVHKRTGEIRTTLPTDGGVEKKLLEAPVPPAAGAASAASGTGQAPQAMQMVSSGTDATEGISIAPQPCPPVVATSNGILGDVVNPEAALAAMASAWFNAGAANASTAAAGMLSASAAGDAFAAMPPVVNTDIQSIPTDIQALGDIAKTLLGTTEDTGALVGINFDTVPDILTSADYDLFAGTLSAEEYNAMASKDVTERAEQAVEAASAAAVAAIAAAPVAMAGLVGIGGSNDGAPLLPNLEDSGGLPPDVDPADLPVESLEAAMAAQMMQLNRFYMQQRVFETQRSMAAGEMPTRFKEGFRPMQLCKQFVKSATCVRGDTCSYAHNQEELHPMSPELPGASSTKAVEAIVEETGVRDDVPEPSMRMQRKRAMCQRMTRGGCLLGKKCPFAHSEAELGTVALAITDRVKTQICKFWEQNKCVYAKYCVNAHGMDEIGKPKPDYLCPPAKQNKKE